VEEPAAEEVAAVWRSWARRAIVGGGMEELGEASAAEEAAAWRSRPRRAAVGPRLLAGGLHRADGCRGGSGVEEPATPGCNLTGAVGGRTSQGGCGQVPTARAGVGVG
jgi:hypothetical protein